MEGPPTFRCPECSEPLIGAELSRHLAERATERRALFDRFSRDHKDEHLHTKTCAGAQEILPLMDAEEKERFGVHEKKCGPDVMRCGCAGSFCAHHTFSCDTCGRFACLRHRWSGTCPGCTRAGGAKPVKVEKYDPFSKQRTAVVRTYRRSEVREAWTPVASGDTET